MSFLKNINNRSSTIAELLKFFWEGRLWWITPFIIVLILVAGLLIFTQSSPILPFLYTVF